MKTISQNQEWLKKDNSQGFFVLLKKLHATSLPQKLREAEKKNEAEECDNTSKDGDFGG